jgi:TPR repeat protein
MSAEDDYLRGCLFLVPNFGTADYRRATEYFFKASQMGHQRAAYIMGELYEHGDGVPANKETALNY